MSKVIFSRPPKSFGSEVPEVEFREPTGAEIRRHGLPFIALPSGGIDFDMERVAQYAVLLSSPPLTPNAIDQLRGGDMIKLAGALAPFFGDSTDPTMS
ncbi:phage tail assembly protein [Ancylobacter sonchi]|uniref:phage tail assembly protein n=1 Tax=Ancylobacter sonchi TaxID=1937790 RepID=UPI001BD49577|nr:phage tail assembly protein [Ancylobacter sonchi]MBS7534997.1 phage tail assembly protein [Ancylobacter sonchi]